MIRKIIHESLRFALGGEGITNYSSLDDYEYLNIIGEGTYGVVYKCKKKQSGEIFAIKTLRNGSGELSTTTLREISILRETNHPNVVSIHDIIISPENVSIVFEYISYDLKRYLTMFPGKIPPIKFTKYIIFEILNGLYHLHTCRTIHRDLKPQNILVTDANIPAVKIADFGLARVLSSPFKTLTREVVTLWYRAPELILGLRNYSCSVDIWSVGCIFVELFIGKPLFPGDSEISTLYMIFKTLGTPSEEIYKGISSLPEFSFEWPKWEINEDWIDKQLLRNSSTQIHFLENEAKELIKM
ncbi:cyclin dependent kinase A [Cryptosporidium ryanae]|uniref:cyclin dependent kinase A n=1 Tax=Cryptosporidium ryanae TaxID=515981 RepID=UPI00351A0E74|nr:cyclin dependent kinase A [Cryptosporidium ryanae]